MKRKALLIPVLSLCLPLSGCFLLGYYKARGLNNLENFCHGNGEKSAWLVDTDIIYYDCDSVIKDAILEVKDYQEIDKKDFEESTYYIEYKDSVLGGEGSDYTSTLFIYDNGYSHIKERSGYDYVHYYFKMDIDAAKGIIDLVKEEITPYQNDINEARAQLAVRCTVEQLLDEIKDESVTIYVNKGKTADYGFKADSSFLKLLRDIDYRFEGVNNPIDTIIYDSALYFDVESYYYCLNKDYKTVYIRLNTDYEFNWNTRNVREPSFIYVIAKYSIDESVGRDLYQRASQKV